ncbi:MAG: hypothetical protein NC122_01475 [Faecalibacterium sp.]|nr:hypothetical protein [Ruminococcus sp.]MCM1391302.1 hypothetical protein [Ruminococcus sp.]MCM1484856.1 hypothetical protein [Faecalibacterium sp.]
MKKQTDMLGIKELMQTFLTLDIETTPHSPIIVKHPFTDKILKSERKKKMTIYQRELLRQLPKFHCTGQMDDESGKLHIFANGIPLGIAGKKNKLYWNQDGQIRDSYRSALVSISDAANSIREYVSLYEVSPPLDIVGLPEYRRLSEYFIYILSVSQT